MRVFTTFIAYLNFPMKHWRMSDCRRLRTHVPYFFQEYSHNPKVAVLDIWERDLAGIYLVTVGMSNDAAPRYLGLRLLKTPLEGPSINL